MMSGFIALIAAIVLGHWRANSVALSAPRQSIWGPPTPPEQPEPKVLKKLRRFMPTTRREPPTAGAEAGRGFDAWKFGRLAPRALSGRTRKALPLAELPAQP